MKSLVSPVVRVGPWPGLERIFMIEKGHLCIYALSQVNPMGVILGRGEDNLSQSEKARVYVNWPGLPFSFGYVGFKEVGEQFYLREPVLSH